ncbi:MAG: 4Fe-4S binding protein, partial [Eubacterium sp.]
MLRKIITIDHDKCNGCGLCVDACHEGAIGLVSGKATLLRDDYCDGLGDCLPVCQADAIHFEMREADAYDEIAVKAKMDAEKDAENGSPQTLACGCP